MFIKKLVKSSPVDRVKNSVEKKIEFMEENNVFLKDNKEDVLGEQKLTGANGSLKSWQVSNIECLEDTRRTEECQSLCF